MKHINKREPQFYTDYIRRIQPVEWGELSREISHYIRIYMLSGLEPGEDQGQNIISEQNYQCAYTEIDIEPESISSHIDHFRKQSIFPLLRFAWSNIFTSTNNEDFGAKYKDNKYRIQQDDYQYLINPANENPNDYFNYSFTGEILIKAIDENSMEFKKAKTTRDVFNLNEKSLVEQRATVAKNIKSYYGQFTVNEIKSNIGKFDNFVENIYQALADLQI